MHSLDADITAHNGTFVEETVEREKDYFDHILDEIDPGIRLDEEQRRAVVTDDDYCLLVAGAGAGKTTTMAAKVKYLVEKQHVNPEEIIVISYTRKAIGELRDRINSGLKIPAEICTFHKFAFDIVKRFSSEPPEVNMSSYKIIFDMLEHAIFHNKPLMRNLVLFMGYYFDLEENVFKFENLDQYHLFKASQDYETLKSSLGEYVKKVEQQRSKRVKTITGEYLRSVQEVQIANFLYLNGLDYMTATVPCMGNDLKEYYGDAVRSTDLTLVTEPVDTVTVTINGKEYTAVSYGVQNLSGVFDGYESREFWRIEDAYDDFKDGKYDPATKTISYDVVYAGMDFNVILTLN